MKKKKIEIPCAGRIEFGCKNTIEVTSLKQWYCDDCRELKRRNHHKKKMPVVINEIIN